MSEPSGSELIAWADEAQAYIDAGDVRPSELRKANATVAALRAAAKPERERVMSKDELETEMRDLAMTVKVATIEACAKVAERFYDVDHSREQEVAVAAGKLVGTQIAASIRALKGTPA